MKAILPILYGLFAVLVLPVATAFAGPLRSVAAPSVAPVHSEVRVGNIVQADLVVRGVLRRGGDREIVLELSIVDPRRADLLAAGSIRLTLDPRGRLAIDEETIAVVADQLGAALREGAERLDALSGKTVVAPLFFRNIGPHSRLDFVEERLFAVLHERLAGEKGLHGLRFSATAEAERVAKGSVHVFLILKFSKIFIRFAFRFSVTAD